MTSTRLLRSSCLYLQCDDKRSTLAYMHTQKHCSSHDLISSYPFTEDELSLTSSQMQTSSPQPTAASAYSLNSTAAASQASNFVTSHMLGQTYATENSNFGPIYHQSHHHSTLPYSYAAAAAADKMYKMPTSSPTNVYQHYHQGFYGHGMMRQVDYPAIKHL